MKTYEVMSLRFIQGIDYAITVKEKDTPGFIAKLLGHKPTENIVVYIGNCVWRNAANGIDAGWNMSTWLQNVLDGHLAVKKYKQHGLV